MGRIGGYIDSLSPSSSFKTFVAWYEGTVRTIRDMPVSGVQAPDRPEKALAAVRQAIHTVLAPTKWQEVDWDQKQGLLVAEHPDHDDEPEGDRGLQRAPEDGSTICAIRRAVLRSVLMASQRTQ